MRLDLEIEESGEIVLSLADDRKIVGSLFWKENNSLSRLLLKKIDQIVQNQKIGVDKISGYKIISHIPKNWTSVRIAKMTLESLVIAGLAK